MSAITASQFEAALPRILKAVKTASFISLDCEFSGLNPASSTRSCVLDSLDARYSKIRASTSAMGLLQFGICCFEHDIPNNRFIARPFSFHLWPRSSSGVGGPEADGDDDATFLSSASSLSFLSRNGFDLNSLVSNGISFMSREQEKKLRNEKRIGIVRRFQRQKLEDEEIEMDIESGKVVRRKCKILITEGIPPAAAGAGVGAGGSAGSAGAGAAGAPLGSVNASSSSLGPQDVPNPNNNNNVDVEDAMTLWQTADIEWYRETVAAIDAWVEEIDAWATASRWGDFGDLMKKDDDVSMMTTTITSDSTHTSPFLTEVFIGEEGSDSSMNVVSSSGSSNASDSVENAAPRIHYPYLLLPPCRSFHRRVIHVHLENAFGHGQSCPILTESRSSDQAGVNDFPYSKRMRLTWVGEPATLGKARFHRLSLQRSLREADVSVDRAIGFRKVIDAISTSGAPVVGHNCWMDLMHSHAKFVGTLPSNLCDFALNLSTLFPIVYDTKHVVAEIAKTDAAAGAAFGYNTSLGLLYSTVNGISTVKIPVSSPKALSAVAASSASVSTAAIPLTSTTINASTSLSTNVEMTSASSATLSTSSSSLSSLAAAVIVDESATTSKPSSMPLQPTQPAAATASAPVRTPFQRRSNYDRGPPVEMETVEIDWKKYIGVELASGYAYATVGGNDVSPSSSSSATSATTTTAAVLPQHFLSSISTPPPPPSSTLLSGEGSVASATTTTTTTTLEQQGVGVAHDAGFDAFMTGVVFARLSARIAAVMAEKKMKTTSTTAANDDIEMASMKINDSSSSSSSSSSSLTSSSSSFLTHFSSLSMFENILFNMRVMDWRFKALNLSHARSLARSNRQRVYAPDTSLHPEDASNTILLARASADRTKVLVAKGRTSSGLFLHTDDLVQLILSGFPSFTPHSLFEGKKHVIWLDDDTAFILLPSATCAEAVLRAARGEGGGGGGDDEIDGGKRSSTTESADSTIHSTGSSRDEVVGGGGGGGGRGVLGVISSLVNAVLGGEKVTRTETSSSMNLSPSPSSSSSSSSTSTIGSKSGQNNIDKTPPFDLSSLPISAFTPESLSTLCPPFPTLQTIGLLSYKEYLIEQKGLYGSECDHEVVLPRFDFSKNLKREGSNIDEISNTEVKKKPS